MWDGIGMGAPDMQYPHVRCRQFLLNGIAPGMHVLDVGCGDGGLMTEIAAKGCSVVGVEIDKLVVQSNVVRGLEVYEGQAERLPLVDESFDAIVCSVVLPYTDEKQSVTEWTRVLKPGGIVNASYHGVGLGLGYVVHGPGWRLRFYGVRMLANTWFYQLTGYRLPGFLGDTLCQTSGRMSSYYRAGNLRLEEELIVDKVMGIPRFLCHRVVKDRELSSIGHTQSEQQSQAALKES
jgi:SAM-dependent methyltransferase